MQIFFKEWSVSSLNSGFILVTRVSYVCVGCVVQGGTCMQVATHVTQILIDYNHYLIYSMLKLFISNYERPPLKFVQQQH